VTDSETQPTLDRLDVLDEVYEQLLAQLERIERETADGAIDPTTAAEQRREVLDDLGHHVMDQPGWFPNAFAFGEIEPELFPKQLFIPSEAPPSWVPVEQRYSHEWIGPDVPGLTHGKMASAASGRMHVVNLVPAYSATADGWAQAAIGIRVRPTYPLSRLTLRPELRYTWNYLMDTPVTQAKWSQTRTRGRLRLVAQQQNLVSGAFETYVQRRIDLWESSINDGSARSERRESGSFPTSDPGLSFIGTSATDFALWLVPGVFLSKKDFDPERRSVCQARLDVEMPMMWLDEIRL
jgi:hypothetical protein